jgi:hypothetical protein
MTAQESEAAMALSHVAQQLRDEYVRKLIEAAAPLQQGADLEVALEALIEATQIVKEKFEQELAEVRQEAD